MIEIISGKDSNTVVRNCLRQAVLLHEISQVVYIDCCFSFDAYCMDEEFKGIDMQEVLSNIFVIRPYTIQQLQHIILGKLEYIIKEKNIKHAIISGINIYLKNDENNNRSILKKIIEKIEEIGSKYKLNTILILVDFN